MDSVHFSAKEIDMDGIVYANGAFRPAHDATVSVFDHGLLYGDGVFEGIRAYNGRVFKLERHIERLFESAHAIRLTIPGTRGDIAALVLEACRRNAISDGYIRLVVTRGAGDLGIDAGSCHRAEVVVIARRVGPLYRRSPSGGVKLVTSSHRRVAPDALSPAIKTLNYLNNVLARFDARDRGADEALFLDRDGFVAEATADNIFILTDGVLTTPPATHTLKGITRETVLELATAMQVKTAERPFTLFDLWSAREAFICGTMAEVVPVGSVDGRVIGDGGVGPLTVKIVAAYDELVRSTGSPINEEAVPAQAVVA
jgi:branched-chain amino acid aminotransferase